MTTSKTGTGILLADEQNGSRDLVVLILEKLGYRLRSVRSGREALTELGTMPGALVLLSATLPDLPGPDAVRVIRALPSSARPSAILVIMPGDHERDWAACRAAGADAHLVRPIELDRLLAWIKRLGASAAPVAADPGEPVIDLERLLGFTDGDLQLESELASLYLSSAWVYVERMAAALEAGTAWREPAHALKGASANLGACQVAALARAAEAAEPCPERLLPLRAALEEVAAFFAARRP